MMMKLRFIKLSQYLESINLRCASGARPGVRVPAGVFRLSNLSRAVRVTTMYNSELRVH
jgi:hypothetical protein